MAGLAFLSRHLSRQPSSHSKLGAAGKLVASRKAAAALAMLSAGEMVADKLPTIPSRTEPAPLAGRAVFGGWAGYLVARQRGSSGAAAACVGAVSAVGSASLFTRLRRRASESRDFPAWMIAVLEDALVVSVGAALVNALDA